MIGIRVDRETTNNGRDRIIDTTMTKRATIIEMMIETGIGIRIKIEIETAIEIETGIVIAIVIETAVRTETVIEIGIVIAIVIMTAIEIEITIKVEVEIVIEIVIVQVMTIGTILMKEDRLLRLHCMRIHIVVGLIMKKNAMIEGRIIQMIDTIEDQSKFQFQFQYLRIIIQMIEVPAGVRMIELLQEGQVMTIIVDDRLTREIMGIGIVTTIVIIEAMGMIINPRMIGIESKKVSDRGTRLTEALLGLIIVAEDIISPAGGQK